MSPARLLNNISSNLPTYQKAIIQGDNGVLSIHRDAPIPKLSPGRILVKVSHVALNPCDWKMAERFPSPGCVDGCDFSGTVVALGSDSSKTGRFRIGDQVCGAVHGSNPIDKTTGSFADYVSADAEFTLKIPNGVTLEQAAAVGGTGMGTMGLALKRCLGLKGSPTDPVNGDDSKKVLVYAASTSIGTLAIQLLKLSGHKPIAVCSPKNFNLVKSYGAVKVFDYHSPSCAQDIRAYTKNSLAYIIDPMTEIKTMQLCYSAMGRAGGIYCCLEMYHQDLCTRRVVKPELVMGMAILGGKVDLDFGYECEADPEKRAFGVVWYQEIQHLLDDGRLKTHPTRLLEGGYEAILGGLKKLKNREVSGEKLIVKLG